jgi:hypothetical protein
LANIGDPESSDARSLTIQILVPDGDPGGFRIIDRMNWTASA